jgi:group I intron endonuclease
MGELAYIYAIENIHNGKMYIGSTKNYVYRWRAHKTTLRKGAHHSFVLQKAWEKYGESSFVFKLLLICSKDTRYFYEQSLMKLQSYNILRTVNECLVRGGWRHSDEFKVKMSKTHKGKALSAEHREKLSVSSTGRKYDDSFKLKARNRQLGVTPSELTRNRLSGALIKHHAETSDKTLTVILNAYHAFKYGDKLSEVVKPLQITTTTFYKYCLKAGLIPVKKKAINDVIIKVDALIAEGLSFNDACDILNINPKQIKTLYRARGKV